LWLPGVSHAGGTQSSNPASSSGESTNFRFREKALRRNRIWWKIGGTLPVARFDDVSRQGIEVTIHNPIGERVDCSTAEMASLEIGSVWRGTLSGKSLYCAAKISVSRLRG
jgi:hypothetical protein